METLTMKSILENTARVGNFTSSQIGKLMTYGKDGKSFGKPALTYIDERNMERRLGRSLQTEISSRPTSWGHTLEGVVFNILDTNYKLSSDETIAHQTIPFFCGSPDGVKYRENGEVDAVFDFKSPFTLKSFCQLVDAKNIEDLRETHSEGDAYYWQITANAILTGAKFGEIIVFVPYLDELEMVKEVTGGMFESQQNKAAWINFANDNDLPYLLRGGHYSNLNIIRFPISEEDKRLLTERVLEAGKLLIKPLKGSGETISIVTPQTTITQTGLPYELKSLPPKVTEKQRDEAKKKLEEWLKLKSKNQ